MERAVEKRKAQFLVASVERPGLQPMSVDVLADNLKRIPDMEVLATLPPPRGIVTAFGVGMPGTEPIVVARMTPERANNLRQASVGQLHIEEDSLLTYGDLSTPRLRALAVQNPGVAVPTGTGFTATIMVTGDGRPLEQAEVYLYGSFWPARGVTDANGRVELTVVGDSPGSLTGLLVQPKADCWSYWLDNPSIVPGENTVVSLESLAKMFPNFPDQELVGWGLKVMNIDQLPPNYRGRGVKVAIIDSGAATSHRDLQQIRLGFDVINNNDQGWKEDLLGHGSHCAGVISGLHNSVGIRGIAPDAEIHVCRIFPGGQYSHLISALNYCIEHEIDVVNLSLGSSVVSDIVARRLALAKEAGVACIVAAGNSSGEVQFPANLSDVLAVAAIGRRGTFPENSYHSQQIYMPGLGGSADGYFSADFTCFGPEIDVAAPGVAIVSSVPPNNFVPMDGTSMAAPHVTGLAALILAHHRDFSEGAFRVHNAARVMQLWDIIKRSCRPLNLGGLQRTGAGLPDALVALGLQPATAFPATPPGQQPLQQPLQQWLAGLLAGAGLPPQGIVPPRGFAPAAMSPWMAFPTAFTGVRSAAVRGPAQTLSGF
jgi:subtilisin family serine protease